jgi:hypothetical protein
MRRRILFSLSAVSAVAAGALAAGPALAASATWNITPASTAVGFSGAPSTNTPLVVTSDGSPIFWCDGFSASGTTPVSGHTFPVEDISFTQCTDEFTSGVDTVATTKSWTFGLGMQGHGATLTVPKKRLTISIGDAPGCTVTDTAARTLYGAYANSTSTSTLKSKNFPFEFSSSCGPYAGTETMTVTLHLSTSIPLHSTGS